MAKEKKKGYDFLEVEAKIRNMWQKEKTFKFDPSKKKVYSIDTPPPTISGNMHIGHAFSYSQQDFIARFRRMFQGVFYPFGTDDNGLPTERLVERLKKVKSTGMSRAAFIDLCLKTISEERGTFIDGWKQLGISADYDICYSTIDENSRRISQKYFIDLYKKGEIYKDEFPTLWCPECQTAIAQAELEDKEFPSKFSTLKFGLVGNEKTLPIATTRPELLPACVAIFVHPEDERFKSFVGKKAVVPLFGQEVSIIADKSADPEKGTGILMICSYGDKFDVDAIQRHTLVPRIVFDKDGTATYKGYEGLKIKEARKKVLENLEKAGLVTETKDITHAVNVHDKCGCEIEFLPTPQWFIKIIDKKKKFIDQGNKIKWYPEYMHKRYDNWVNGLEWDWNISRSRHFGIPLPVWECKECGEIILPEEKELPIDPLQTEKKCPKCNKPAKPEEMVLDTWATSSLSPKLASSLVGDKIDLPYSLRPQAHDIIRTWAFYTIVRAHLHENKMPWEEIMISGNVSLKGEKMSKSKGNVIDPKEVLEKYGADPLRFWAAGSTLGNDLDYMEEDLITGKKTVNKLWNASKFVFMNLEDFNGKAPKKLEKIDEIFLTKVGITLEKITRHFEKYEYSKARAEFDQFFWKDFCDNYLEIVKKRVYHGEGDKRKSSQYALYNGLLVLLKTIAPIMPFVTEEIYQTYYLKKEKIKSIHLCDWPKPEFMEQKRLDQVYLGQEFTGVLEQIRKEKTKAQKSMNSEVKISLEKSIIEELAALLDDLKDVTNAKEIVEGDFGVEFL
ncbi:valine--tRNA ligase [Candidatus Pacearchaeota archaeon]|nr:valine--tRNA ligase [Candidatus Pacearchaeota archaeon]|tara:strand:+ start:685 stop:3042 length:2358 start_codon:yes stop_codon:yes gene_type:complete